ncbi:hypothetical protein ACFSKW_43225 [Nonomuraea mangrovi]|uniref:Uncharacterized protein n=1 Tax=Nonomuraea mangrovi TaxID=2316207 RepID=A0ABW4TA95_9ACTN
MTIFEAGPPGEIDPDDGPHLGIPLLFMGVVPVAILAMELHIGRECTWTVLDGCPEGPR